MSHPPTPVYSFIITPGLCRIDMGVFLSAGVREYAYTGLYLVAGPGVETAQAQITSLHSLIGVCDVCISSGYENTNDNIAGLA